MSVELPDEAQAAFLIDAAKRYIWWETPEEALTRPRRILAQVMNIGVWDDLCRMVELFPSQELTKVLEGAEPGEFNGRSWHFWCNRLMDEIPPLPRRVFP